MAFVDSWADVIGLIIAVLGLIGTVMTYFKSKTAAQKADEAARATKETLLKSQALTNCSEAVNLIEEIRTFHRDSLWDQSLYRYSRLRTLLLTLKADQASFCDEDCGTLGSVLRQIGGCEKEVEKAKMDSHYNIKTERLNDILRNQANKVHELLNKLKFSTRRRNHEHNGKMGND